MGEAENKNVKVSAPFIDAGPKITKMAAFGYKTQSQASGCWTRSVRGVGSRVSVSKRTRKKRECTAFTGLRRDMPNKWRGA